MTIEAQAGGNRVDLLGILAVGSSDDPWDSRARRAGATGIDQDGFDGGSVIDPVGDPESDGGRPIDPTMRAGGSVIGPVSIFPGKFEGGPIVDPCGGVA
jgi:hypothetical protein